MGLFVQDVASVWIAVTVDVTNAWRVPEAASVKNVHTVISVVYAATAIVPHVMMMAANARAMTAPAESVKAAARVAFRAAEVLVSAVRRITVAVKYAPTRATAASAIEKAVPTGDAHVVINHLVMG